MYKILLKVVKGNHFYYYFYLHVDYELTFKIKRKKIFHFNLIQYLMVIKNLIKSIGLNK